jgi:hypothetical protein
MLIGLVLVLLAMCGGLAVTAWTVIGPEESPSSAASGRPVAAPVRTPAATAPGRSASPTAGPSVAPAGSGPVPFGISHSVIWPDHLRATVTQARVYQLSGTRAAANPASVAVLIRIRILNDTGSDVTISQARLLLWYGADRRPAEEFVDRSANFGVGFDVTMRPGGTGTGDYAFVVPEQSMDQLTIEFRPRVGDAPGRFAGSAA